jgi:hypothetical protein
MSTSIFEQVTSSLTVLSICGSLGPDIPAGTPLFDVEKVLDPGDDFDPNDPSPVIDSGGDLVGFLWFEDWGVDQALEEEEVDSFVDDVMDRPEPSQFLSSDTTILEAVQLFTSKPTDLFYVIHGNQVVGYLRYRHLFQPVGRLTFLALAVGIEDQALRLCQHPPFRKAAWQSISDGRRCKAIELFKNRYEREPEQPRDIDRLIDCTQLVDKATMIWKTKLLPSASGSQSARHASGDGSARDRRRSAPRLRCARPDGRHPRWTGSASLRARVR